MAPRPLPALSHDQVNWLFDNLSLRYGSVFTDRWRDIDLKIVKADWALQLGQQPPAAVRWAMENLPSQPPMVMDFKRLCIQAPQEYVALRSDFRVRGPTEREKEEIAALIASFAGKRLRTDREWAYRLIERHESREFESTAAALKMAREAIKLDHRGEWDAATLKAQELLHEARDVLRDAMPPPEEMATEEEQWVGDDGEDS